MFVFELFHQVNPHFVIIQMFVLFTFNFNFIIVKFRLITKIILKLITIFVRIINIKVNFKVKHNFESCL